MNLQLLRHATLIIDYAGQRLLVDPMFNPPGTSDPIANTPNPQRNPLIEMPLDDVELAARVTTLDAVLVSHTHGDHWDARARELLPAHLPIFCQPEDEATIRDAGFLAVQPIIDHRKWGSIVLYRTGGEHGHGEMAQLMAPVSGFVLQAPGEPTLYIAGDTVWCEVVAEVIAEHQPTVVVVNAGAAQFNTGGPITMTADDVLAVAEAQPEAAVVAVHMEAINHCLLRRDELRAAVDATLHGSRIVIPADGETVRFA